MYLELTVERDVSVHGHEPNPTATVVLQTHEQMRSQKKPPISTLSMKTEIVYLDAPKQALLLGVTRGSLVELLSL